jgi:tripartite-type tricarboxylate transporter receptor subunit TctC
MRQVQILLAATFITSAMAGAVESGGVEPNFPKRPVRMVVGFPPGEGTEIMAHIIAPKIIESRGHQVTTDNRIGTTGTIGASLVARASPDSYTLLNGHLSVNAIGPSIFSITVRPR